MAWTYSGDPADSDRDALRFCIGDTDTGDQQMNDAELDFLLTQKGSVAGAAVEAVRKLIAKYSRQVNKSVGDLRLSLSDRVKSYKMLLRELQAALNLKTGGPIAGGISLARKDTVKENTDRVVPDFERGKFDHPGTENSNNLDDRNC